MKELFLEYKWILALLLGFTLYYFYLTYQNKKIFSSTKQEYNQLLTNDEYKVKSNYK